MALLLLAALLSHNTSSMSAPSTPQAVYPGSRWMLPARRRSGQTATNVPMPWGYRPQEDYHVSGLVISGETGTVDRAAPGRA
jgi:hypothetical protein